MEVDINESTSLQKNCINSFTYWKEQDSIEFEFSGEFPHELRVVDIQGEIILKKNIYSGELVSVKSLAQGIYLLKICYRDIREGRLFIKHTGQYRS